MRGGGPAPTTPDTATKSSRGIKRARTGAVVPPLLAAAPPPQPPAVAAAAGAAAAPAAAAQAAATVTQPQPRAVPVPLMPFFGSSAPLCGEDDGAMPAIMEQPLGMVMPSFWDSCGSSGASSPSRGVACLEPAPPLPMLMAGALDADDNVEPLLLGEDLEW